MREQFQGILALMLLVLCVSLHSAAAFVPIPRISRPTSPSILQPSMCVCPFPASLRRIRAASTDDVQRRRRRLRHVATGAFWRMQKQEADAEKNERSSMEGSFSGAVQAGSVFGASLLFAGTAVGAGMLALPDATARAGFWPAECSLLLSWIFTYATSLLTLEASWLEAQDRDARADGRGGGGFLGWARVALGPAGEVSTALLFYMLLTSLLVAYTSKGGELVAAALGSVTGLTPSGGSVLFMAAFAVLVVFGTVQVDVVNRALVAGLLLTFFGLIGIGLPQLADMFYYCKVKGELLSRADVTAIWPNCISIGILSFGAQNVVPTLLQYLGGDAERTKLAIVAGSLLPLCMYSMWEAVFLGIVTWDGGVEASERVQIVDSLAAGRPLLQVLISGFSFCAISSSMAGASISLVDFFADVLAQRGGVTLCGGGVTL